MHLHCKILRKAPSEVAGFSNAGVERMKPSSAVDGLKLDMLIIEVNKNNTTGRSYLKTNTSSLDLIILQLRAGVLPRLDHQPSSFMSFDRDSSPSSTDNHRKLPDNARSIFQDASELSERDYPCGDLELFAELRWVLMSLIKRSCNFNYNMS